MDCTVTPLKTLMGFSVHLNVQLKFYNLPIIKYPITINNWYIETLVALKDYSGGSVHSRKTNFYAEKLFN